MKSPRPSRSSCLPLLVLLISSHVCQVNSGIAEFEARTLVRRLANYYFKGDPNGPNEGLNSGRAGRRVGGGTSSDGSQSSQQPSLASLMPVKPISAERKRIYAEELSNVMRTIEFQFASENTNGQPTSEQVEKLDHFKQWASKILIGEETTINGLSGFGL